MSAFALLLLVASLSVVQAAVGGEQPATLPDVVKRLKVDAKTTGEELIKTGMKFIKEGTAPRLVDDLAFLAAVADRKALGPQHLKNLEALVEILEHKYKDEPDALLRVLLLEADLYRDCLADRKKEREVLEKAEILQEGLLTQQALSQLALFVKLGESYLGVVDPQSKNQKKAGEYFAKVLEFEFPGRPSSPRYGDYHVLYIKAASRLVEMTKPTELKNLRFHPFAFDELEHRYPEKVKLIGTGSPSVAAINAKVERWLEGTAHDLPKKSPMRPHFEALLQYLRKDRPE